jgi:hypothetical protein
MDGQRRPASEKLVISVDAADESTIFVKYVEDRCGFQEYILLQ